MITLLFSLIFIFSPFQCLWPERKKKSGDMMGFKNGRKKDWLGGGLLIENFGNCENHKDLKCNEKNMFCVDCGVSLCRNCKEDHYLHQRFQIFRYTYEHVVRSSDLQKYFDCSNIQTYTANNEKIVLLKPKLSIKDIKLAKRVKFASPIHESQAKREKRSTPQKQGGGNCEECGKYLLDKRNRFCSIACKISIVSEEHVKQNYNQNSEEGSSSISVAEQYECVEKVNFRKRPRKTTPLRSPPTFIC